MTLSLILTLSSFGFAQKNAQANPPKSAALCIACHGAAGISNNDLWPNLAGQKKDYLHKQIVAFQTGDRKDPLMTPIAANLSKEEVTELANFFAGLSPAGK
jgi:cytochrome c553